MSVCTLPCGERNPSAARTFTLIELLVVIAIIAILASLLLPALSTAREKGRQSTCIGQLKELGTALSLYADDYDDWYPSAGRYNANPDWPDLLSTYVQFNYAVRTQTRSYGIFHCPSGLPSFHLWPAHSHGQTLGYALNRSTAYDSPLAGDALWGGCERVKSVKFPDTTFTILDGRYPSDLSLGMAIEAYVETGNHAHNSGQQLQAISFRHNGFCNVLFVAGHVAARGKGPWIVDGTRSNWLPQGIRFYNSP